MAATPKKPAKNPMDAFLKGAQKNIDAKAVVENTEKTREAQRAATLRAQEAFVSANIIPLVDQLVSLPQKGGRKFVVTDARFTGDERYYLNLEYKGGVEIRNTNRGGSTRGPSLTDGITLIVDSFKSEDDFSIRLVRKDQYVSQDNKTHLVRVYKSLDALYEAIGDFVGAVAANRMGELGGTAPATPPSPPQDPHQGSNELWSGVKDKLEGFLDDLPAPEVTRTPARPRPRGRR